MLRRPVSPNKGWEEPLPADHLGAAAGGEAWRRMLISVLTQTFQKEFIYHPPAPQGHSLDPPRAQGDLHLREGEDDTTSVFPGSQQT